MSKKSKSTVEPSKFAKPYIAQGANALNDAYGANSGKIQQATDDVTGLLMPELSRRFTEGDAGVNAARGYNVDVLSGNYLNANPWFDQVVGAANDDIRNQSQAALGAKGLTGGSSYADIISRNIGRNTSTMRMGNYDNERSRMATAAGQAPGLASADYLPVAGLLDTLNASTVPLQAAGQYAGGLGGLFSPYVTQTNKQGAGSILGGLLGAGLSGWASGGFKGA